MANIHTRYPGAIVSEKLPGETPGEKQLFVRMPQASSSSVCGHETRDTDAIIRRVIMMCSAVALGYYEPTIVD